jgi:hypothetical protein
MLSSTAYGRNIIPPQIWTNRSIAIQILTLLMWQNFNTKQGTQKKKTVGMETLDTHFLLTVYILRQHLTQFFSSFYVILYRIRKEHYSSTNLLLYHCANDWFFGQLHSDFNLAYVAEFQYKAGYPKKKTVGMETLDTHFLLTVYILYKRTKFHSHIFMM